MTTDQDLFHVMRHVFAAMQHGGEAINRVKHLLRAYEAIVDAAYVGCGLSQRQDAERAKREARDLLVEAEARSEAYRAKCHEYITTHRAALKRDDYAEAERINAAFHVWARLRGLP